MADIKVGQIVFVEDADGETYYGRVTEWLPFHQVMVSRTGMNADGMVYDQDQIRALNTEERGYR